jgi:uridine kinase
LQAEQEGKTTVVHQIMNELPDTEVGIISQDSYYKENHNLSFDERALLNFDHPRAIDFVVGSPSKRA